MFCGKCGRPIPDGQNHCEFCNPASQAPVNAVPQSQRPVNQDVWGQHVHAAQNQQPLAQQSPVQQTPAQQAFEVSAPVKNKPKKEKKAKSGKGGKGIIAVVSLVLVALVALTVIFWGNISRFFQRNFGDPAEYLKDVENENIVAVADDVAAAYDTVLTSYAVENPSAEGTITLEMSDSMTALIETLLASQGMDLDLSWVKSIMLTPRMEMYENTIRYDIGVGLNNVNLVTVSAILDMDSGMVYIGAPELHDTYISIDFYDMFGYEAEYMMETLTMTRTLSETLVDALPESEDVKELIVKYVGIIVDSFAEAEKENTTVEVNGLEQDLLMVSVDLSQKDILKVAKKVLEEAQDDKTIEDILNGIDEVMLSLYGYEMGLYDEFSMGVEDALENLEYAMDEAESKTFLTVETYLDKKDNVVGRTLTVKADGEKMSVYYVTVTEGDEWAFEAELGMANITGEGTLDGDATSGSYTLSVGGDDYITLELDGFVFTDGKLSGTVKIIPEDYVYDMAGISYSSMLEDAALALTFGEKSVKVGIETAGTTFVAFTVTGQSGEAGPIALPASIDVNDDTAGMEWVSQLDLEAVLDSLSKAGVPSEYMDMAEYLVDMFHDQF